MQKFFGKLFLAVFFVLVNIAGFLIPASMSYGDAPIEGEITISVSDECHYGDDWESYYTKVPFTIKVGRTSDTAGGTYVIYYAAQQKTALSVGSTLADTANCQECDDSETGFYRGAEGFVRGKIYHNDSSSNVKEVSMVLIIAPSVSDQYDASTGKTKYCPLCYSSSAPVTVKYRIYDVLNSYDEEFSLSDGLERDVNFLSASGDRIRFKFKGKSFDKVSIKATITNYGNISEEKWEKPGISIHKINYGDDGTVGSIYQEVYNYGMLGGTTEYTLGGDGDYYITVYNPTYDYSSTQGSDSCYSISGEVPVHISITSNALVVNTTGDEPDADLTDGVCDIDLSTGGEQCTLRAAIQEANKREGEDTITFESSVSAISPGKSLPDIIEAVTIDASSNSSSVEVNGSNAGKDADGFSIKNGNLTVKNLTVSGFSKNGVKADGDGDVTLESVTIRENGHDGIRARGYVQLSSVEVTDNKAYGVFAKNDIVISGSETTVSKFSNNGKIGLYSQAGDVAANDATLQVENNGDAGIFAEKGDVIINFVPNTSQPAYVGQQSIIKGNGKSGIIANGGRRANKNDEDTKIGNVKASYIAVEGNGVKIKEKIAPKPSQRNGGHGINASGYVQLIEASVVDNKGYGISSKYDVIISGSETATNEFNNNKGAGIYSQSGNVTANDVIISVEENGRFGIGTDKGGVFLNNATVINNKGVGIVAGGDLSITKGKVCDNTGGDIKVKGEESLGEDVVVCDRENL